MKYKKKVAIILLQKHIKQLRRAVVKLHELYLWSEFAMNVYMFIANSHSGAVYITVLFS